MEAYPPEYVEHNLPLVLLSGLGHESAKTGKAVLRQDSGSRLVLDSDECKGQQAEQLLQALQNHDGTDAAWNGSAASGFSGLPGYRMKAIGRSYTLPARKAAPPPQSPSAEGGQSYMNNPTKGIELHSTLSPLSPGSPIFPDGIFTPRWFAKHQSNVPCQILAFFSINADAGEAQDQRIQADIASSKAALGRSGFKTKFSAVLISDESILHAPQLEDRLTAIRRTTGLDSKTGMFFMPPMSSQAEIEIFVQATLAALQPYIMEYYRDLTKHARRKKTRGPPPPNAALSAYGGASKALTTCGWNVRYDLKLGAFAEFRQEMEGAERHYESCIEELFSSEGVHETVPSWSPRWNEARLVCDAVAIRIMRCQLWQGSTSGAARSWSNYRARMKELVDQRGKGSESYGWQAWEARWAQVMAQLIKRADLPAFKIEDSEAGQNTLRSIYARPEKGFAVENEPLPPFYFLHHPGYWHMLSGKSLRARRERASAIPEEDRLPPGQSPASAVAKRSGAYDSYLVPDPHEEASLATDSSDKGLLRYIAENQGNASVELLARGQERLTVTMAIELANDYMDVERYEDAFQVLSPMWAKTSWREDSWLGPLAQLLLALHKSAVRCGHADVVLGTSWEMLRTEISRLIDPKALPESLEPLGSATGEVEISYTDEERSGPISVAFGFASKEGHVSEPLQCQLQITNKARPSSTTIAMSAIEIHIGQSRKVKVSHRSRQREDGNANDKRVVAVEDVSLNADGLISGHADLSFSPGQATFLTFPIIFREADEVDVRQIRYTVEGDRFAIHHTVTDPLLFAANRWYQDSSEGDVSHTHLSQFETTTVTVLPKPPKLRLEVHGLRSTYYVDEPVALTLQLRNDESDAVNARATRTVTNDDESTALSSKWNPDVDAKEADDAPDNEAEALSIPAIEAGSSHKVELLIQGSIDPATFKLAVDVRYTLAHDPDTELLKSLFVELSFVGLLDFGYSFGPLYHPAPWPNYFAFDRGQSQGLRQKWRLDVALASLAGESVDITDASIEIDHVAGGASCEAILQSEHTTRTLNPRKTVEFPFELETNKASLDDRRPLALDLTLAITWSRKSDAARQVTTRLPIPRQPLPTSEPRVLCTASPNTSTNPATTLSYHLENPSLHFLTFAVTMEASEDFAFSGPKYRTLSLAPLSRHSVQYRLLLHESEAGQADKKRGGTWVWPVLQVVDTTYHKTLRLQTAGQGVKNDERGRVGVLMKTE